MLPVRITPRAKRHIAQAVKWWAENRDKAPSALIEDLEEAYLQIATFAGIGAKEGVATARRERRILLPRVRYHLYYRVVGTPPRRVEVLALWHASRGAEFVREPASQYVQPRARAA